MEEVRRLRLEKGWNQNELAFHAGLAPSVISLLETGKREPNATTLRKLAQALDVEIPDLFGRVESPKAPAPSPEAEQGRRAPVLTEAVIATVDKWIDIASDSDTNGRASYGVSRAAGALGDAIEEVVENAGEASWDSLPSREQHEIVHVMEKITEVIEVAAQRMKDDTQRMKVELAEEEFSQRREKIREWTRRITA